MRELSIFVDESGDFGSYSEHSPYYLVSMIFHDQSKDITKQIKILNNELKELGFENHAIHTEPLIRREESYKYLEPNVRRSIFTKLYYFTCRCEIKYKSFVFSKKEYMNSFMLEERMTKDLSFFIRENLCYFQQFDRVVLYYDNGQHELSQILNKVLSAELSHYDIKKVLPVDYKLFQAADLICTLELLSIKSMKGNLSRSEELLFHSKKELKKDFLRGIRKKRFKE